MYYFFQRETSEVPRSIAEKFCHVLGSMFNFITPVQEIGEPAPQKIFIAKTVLNSARFWTTLDFESVSYFTDCNSFHVR